MLDTSIYHTSETTTGVSCSPTNLVTLRDRNNKTWMIQKELIAWVREEEFSKAAASFCRTTNGLTFLLVLMSW